MTGHDRDITQWEESFCLLDEDGDWWVSQYGARFTCVFDLDSGELSQTEGLQYRGIEDVLLHHGICDDGTYGQWLDNYGSAPVALTRTGKPEGDAVKHPTHYTSNPSGIETIEFTRHMGFCLGNVVKYVMRADHKGTAVQDLRKAIQYLEFEIETRERAG